MRIRPEFLRVLSRTIDLARLEDSRHTIFGLTPELRLAYFNPAWLEYAAMGGAPSLAQSWPLGRSLLAALPPLLRSFYVEGYATALGSGETWSAEYQANTPYRLRTMAMHVQPLAGRAGLVVINFPVADAPLVDARPADDKRFRHGDGRLRQCVSCRAFRAPGEAAWELVPSWMALPPPRISSELCAACAAQHHPARALAA